MLMKLHYPCGRAIENENDCKWCKKAKKKSPQRQEEEVQTNRLSGEIEPNIAD